MDNKTIFRILVALTAVPAAVRAGEPAPDPVADPAAVVVRGNARFTVLTPNLVRMEYSPTGEFEDRASQVIINRRLPVPKYETREENGKLIIETDRVHIRYGPGNGPFSKDNFLAKLRIGQGGAEEWWEAAPPFEQCANLGGTLRTLDGISGSRPLEPGLFNRYGWIHIDDSQTLVFDGDPPWPEPRRPGSTDGYLFVFTDDYKAALGEFIEVAGRIPLPPRFVFGSWWSRYWAYSADELKQLVTDFRTHDVPLDVLVIDMDWHLDGWTGYTWNPDYFPDPDGFLQWAHDQGLKITLNLHPADGVGQHEAAFEAVAADLGINPQGTERIPFDCTDQKYVDAYFKRLHHPLEEQGVDFWWIDWQQGTDTRIPGLDPLWWLNHLHWTDMHRRAAETNRRSLIFSRWGGLGNHRYQIGFSGDTFCNWPSLAFQPYFTATAGNVGFAYWSHDIGGHQPGPVDPELYTRWIQWGALSPILRTHTTKRADAERRVWKLPEEYFEASRKAFHLRYELIPYIYTMARKCYDTGVPLCRPLYYEWPLLDEAYTRKGQYMFGDDLLVAPVTEPVDKTSGCAMVEVWIPPGRWTNWFTGRVHQGPVDARMLVPLDEIPLFARAGAVIPAALWTHRSDAKPLDRLVVNIFPGESGSTRLYEDDGRSAAYIEGRCAWTEISHQLVGGDRIIRVAPPVGSFDGMTTDRAYDIRLFDVPAGFSEVTVNGKPIGATTGPQQSDKSYWWYNPRIMGPEIRISERTVRDGLEVVIREIPTDPARVSALNGFRGLMSVLCDINRRSGGVTFGKDQDCESFEWVLTLPERSIEEAAEYWLENWSTYLSVEARSGRDPRQQMENLVRLLGLYFKVTVEPESGDSGRMIVKLCVAATHPVPGLKNLSAHAMLFPLNGWQTLGKKQWRMESLMADVPLRGETRLAPEGPIGTGRVRAGLTIRGDNLGFGIPMDVVFLPSINEWWILGPFDAPFDQALDRKFPPEEGIDLSGTYPGKDGVTLSWRQVRREIKPDDDITSESFVDFDDVFGRRVYEAVSYALTYLEAPEDTDAVLAIGSDDGVVVWLNGEQVHRVDGGRAYSSKQDRVPVKLQKGINTLLLKINQGGGDWGFGVHVESPEGDVLPQVRVILNPQ